MKKAQDIGKYLDRAHRADCLKLMQRLPDESVQMVFADPPFNLSKKYLSYKDNLPLQTYLTWTRAWLTEAVRVLRDDGSLFLYNIPKLLTYSSCILNELAEFRHWIAWNSNGRPLGKTLQPAHYGILFYTKTRKNKFYDVRAPHKACRHCGEYAKDYGGKEYLRHAFGCQISDVWDDIHRVRHASKRIASHPCQLPVHLIERMILMTTDEGDIMLDPFCGSGAGGVAAKQMGRRYIGAELDPAYQKEAQRKLRQAEPVKTGNAYLSLHLGKIVSIRDKDIQALPPRRNPEALSATASNTPSLVSQPMPSCQRH